MKNLLVRLLAGAALVAVGNGVATGAPIPVHSAPASIATIRVDPGWECRSSENICGLRDKQQLSNPAKVDWSTLLGETAEMKEVAKKGLDPNSPEGIRLKNKAESRLRQACETEMADGGYCSIWKDISHKDGRDIPDLTAQIRARVQ